MPVTLVKSSWTSGSLKFEQTVASGSAAVIFGDGTGGGVGLNFAGALSAPFDFDGATNYFADFSGAGVAGISLTSDGMSQNPETASEDAFLTVLVGASTYEIPLYLNT